MSTWARRTPVRGASGAKGLGASSTGHRSALRGGVIGDGSISRRWRAADVDSQVAGVQNGVIAFAGRARLIWGMVACRSGGCLSHHCTTLAPARRERPGAPGRSRRGTLALGTIGCGSAGHASDWHARWRGRRNPPLADGNAAPTKKAGTPGRCPAFCSQAAATNCSIDAAISGEISAMPGAFAPALMHSAEAQRAHWFNPDRILRERWRMSLP